MKPFRKLIHKIQLWRKKCTKVRIKFGVKGEVDWDQLRGKKK